MEFAPFGDVTFAYRKNFQLSTFNFQLFYVEDEAFEVFAFWVVDVDWVVNWLSELVQDAHRATTLGCRSEDSKAELLFADGLRTREGEKDATWTDLFESEGIEACVATESIAESIAVLSKCWWVEDDEVVFVFDIIEIFEGIDCVSFVARVAWEVEFDVFVS